MCVVIYMHTIYLHTGESAACTEGAYMLNPLATNDAHMRHGLSISQ